MPLQLISISIFIFSLLPPFLTGLVSKPGCQDTCGGLSITYPFGIGSNCSLAPPFEIICNTSINPPKAYLPILNAEILDLNSSEVLIKYPNLGFACYNLSDYQNGVTKREEDRLIIDLSGTQYMLSDKNSIRTRGCDDMLTAVTGQANRSLVESSCASVCWEDSEYYGGCSDLQGTTTSYVPGNGCCVAPLPRGTTYLEANLSDLSVKWRRRKLFSCSSVYVDYVDPSARESSGFSSYMLNNSKAIQESRQWSRVMLDWRIGQDNCEKARQNRTNYACQANTICVEFETKVGGYLCNCSEGYHGNPYLYPGCQDVNECASNTTNPCASNSNCNNTPGSFSCSCPKGYYGDARKDGMGCIHVPKTKSKTIIIIGLGAGFALLLQLLLCRLLCKFLTKRKERMLKEKFFKQNGGLFLQQQTNEGGLGQTKVFLGEELKVATDNFNESRILGQGGQGTVYKGMLSDGQIVAVKKSKLVEANQLEQFINEMVILSQINHRNVVKLLGCCLETEAPLLVYEYMPNGTLFDLIHDPNKEFPFPWNMRLKTAADTAGALAYLHSASSMPSYHRDIKSSNILLDEKYVVKVSDFGTSRSVAADKTHLTTLVKGTFGYLDPEYFESSQFTEKSDVYSFGVVLVELLTRQMPISLVKTDEDRGLAARFLTSMEENDLDAILDPQVWEEDKKGEVILVAKLAQRCLNLKGKMRPTMKEVATELESFRISQMAADAENEFEEMRDFDDMSKMISDTEWTWSGSYKGTATLSIDIHP